MEVPPLTGRLVDLAGVLSSDAAESLTAELAAHERRTGHQIALLTIPSLGGEPLETFAHRVATTWKLGGAGIDDGVLVVIVTEDRLVRLEVGYGLEGRLPDARASRIIRQEMVPQFRAGDYPGAVAAGLRAIMAATDEPASPDNTLGSPAQPQRSEAPNGLFVAVVVGAVLGGLIGSQVLMRGGVLGGIIGFAMAASAGLLLASVAAALAGLGAIVLGLLFRFGGGRPRRGMGYDRGGAPWPGHPTEGFGQRDVFIGGGGDFGGGGASGRW